jgi:hypothetical protein
MILCEICNKPLSEKQILKAKHSNRVPKYCSSYCWSQRPRDYNYNHEFLDNINTFAAYFTGLFVTDGNCSNDGVGIELADKQLIDDIIKVTEYKNPVNPRIRANKPNASPTYVVRYAGNVFKRIKEMGYLPGVKTGKEFIPSCITDELFPHFLRGVIDGDGWWTIHNKDYEYIHCGICCSNASFLVTIWGRLQRLGIVSEGNLNEDHSPNRLTRFFRLQFGHEDSQRIGDYIYKDAEIKLDRKYNIYKLGNDRKLLQKQAGLICSIEGCGKETIAKQLCKTHYDQQCGKAYRESHKEEIYEKQKIYNAEHKDQINERRRGEYAENSEKYCEYASEWRKNNPEKVKEIKKNYRENHKDEINEYKREYREKNLEHVREKEAESRARNSEKRKEEDRARYLANKEKRLQKAKEYREANREKIRASDNARYAEKKNNPT